ncbi:MAG: hypothetical protein FH753_16430 [Firmicutes bacterium]|nr:hypothetical protein [Bacillota bacterium]
MNIKTIALIVLVLSASEIFFNIFTNLFLKIVSSFKKDYSFSEKFETGFKLFWIAIFLASTIYFLDLGVRILARWFNIPLDKSFLDLFR